MSILQLLYGFFFTSHRPLLIFVAEPIIDFENVPPWYWDSFGFGLTCFRMSCIRTSIEIELAYPIIIDFCGFFFCFHLFCLVSFESFDLLPPSPCIYFFLY